MIKIAIVDNDEESVDRLKGILARYGEENAADFKVSVFHSGIDFVSGYTADYDIVFMEVYMPHLDGIKTAKMLRELDGGVTLIFTANSPKYAIHGYDVNARQFLIKPLEYATFVSKLGKDIDSLNQARNGEPFLIVDSRENTRQVVYSDIFYATVRGRYVHLHTKSEIIEMHVSMKELESMLTGSGFVRGDNSSMVNLMHVTSVTGEGAIVNGEVIPCSRNRRKALVDAFTHYTENSPSA